MASLVLQEVVDGLTVNETVWYDRDATSRLLWTDDGVLQLTPSGVLVTRDPNTLQVREAKLLDGHVTFIGSDRAIGQFAITQAGDVSTMRNDGGLTPRDNLGGEPRQVWSIDGTAWVCLLTPAADGSNRYEWVMRPIVGDTSVRLDLPGSPAPDRVDGAVWFTDRSDCLGAVDAWTCDTVVLAYDTASGRVRSMPSPILGSLLGVVDVGGRAFAYGGWMWAFDNAYLGPTTPWRRWWFDHAPVHRDRGPSRMITRALADGDGLLVVADPEIWRVDGRLRHWRQILSAQSQAQLPDGEGPGEYAGVTAFGDVVGRGGHWIVGTTDDGLARVDGDAVTRVFEGSQPPVAVAELRTTDGQLHAYGQASIDARLSEGVWARDAGDRPGHRKWHWSWDESPLGYGPPGDWLDAGGDKVVVATEDGRYALVDVRSRAIERWIALPEGWSSHLLPDFAVDGCGRLWGAGGGVWMFGDQNPALITASGRWSGREFYELAARAEGVAASDESLIIDMSVPCSGNED